MAFTEELICKVWEKGNIIPGFDPEEQRRDDFGEWIFRPDYGKRDSIFGSEIDRIDPYVGYVIENLRPVQWKIVAAKERNNKIE